MDQCPEPDETCVLLQIEAAEEHLESHFGIQMRELRAVEVEADSALRTVLHALEPKKRRLLIDVSPDQPRGGDPIDPQTVPGGRESRVFGASQR